MKLLCDTREQAVLQFPTATGIEVIRRTLPYGDYGALHEIAGRIIEDSVVVERKSLADLFGSFTRHYDREKAKWERAKARGRTYVLAIEGTFTDVLRGHAYWAKGESHEAKKSGLAQARQLCSIERRYGVQVWYCQGRREMAWRIQEFYLAWERMSHDVDPEARPSAGAHAGREG